MNRLDGRVALVTGAASGIGEAMVELLAEAGVPTVAVARRKDRLDALAARFPQVVDVMVADLESEKGAGTRVRVALPVRRQA